MTNKPKIIVLHPFPTSWGFIIDASRMGFEIWATDPAQLRLPDEIKDLIYGFLEKPLNNVMALSDEISNLSDIKMFYPGSEMAVVAAAELSEKFNLPGNPVGVARKTRYKDLMRNMLQEIVPENNPKFAIIYGESDLKKAAKNIGFPSVFKRTDFAGSYGISLVNDFRDLERCFGLQSSLSELPFGESNRRIFLLEELIVGQEYSIESMTFDGSSCIMGVTKKTTSLPPYFIETKHQFPAQLFGTSVDKINAMCDLANILYKSVEFSTCIGHLELRWDENIGKPVIIEIASRAGGGHIPDLLRESVGHAAWLPLLKCLRGELTRPPGIEPRYELRMEAQRKGCLYGEEAIQGRGDHPQAA